jgi:glycosyltransferase involved in cell wall biosynthesis
MSKSALLAHPGTQYSHQLARQLFRKGVLEEFWTGFALAEDVWSGKMARGLLPERLKRKLANRVLADVPHERLKTMPLTEFKSLMHSRNGNGVSALQSRNRVFQEQIPQASLERASVVIGFDTSSWILANRVRELGKPFLLDQSIAHPAVNESTSRFLSREFPDWQTTIEGKSANELECERHEHGLATKIIAASTFTKKTLAENGIPPEKIVVNPYGVNLKLFHPPTEPRQRGPIRFLLSSESARKGVPLLIKSWQSLKLQNSELWLVGPISPSQRSLIPDSPTIKIKGKYPLEELPALIRQCDVMVFPSYCEGFALVLLEALASGLPIITTEATAGPDLIEPNKEGFLIPSGNLDALSDSIKFFADDPTRVEAMSRAARLCAERFSWDSYGDRWAKILHELN